MARLGWSLSSQQDLAEIGEFIARDSALYAIGMVERMIGLGRYRIEPGDAAEAHDP